MREFICIAVLGLHSKSISINCPLPCRSWTQPRVCCRNLIHVHPRADLYHFYWTTGIKRFQKHVRSIKNDEINTRGHEFCSNVMLSSLILQSSFITSPNISPKLKWQSPVERSDWGYMLGSPSALPPLLMSLIGLITSKTTAGTIFGFRAIAINLILSADSLQTRPKLSAESVL